MVNQEHLAILTQGVETWNQWRKEHVDIQPDLVDAILCKADLRDIDFHDTNLNSAILNGVSFDGADFCGGSTPLRGPLRC